MELSGLAATRMLGSMLPGRSRYGEVADALLRNDMQDLYEGGAWTVTKVATRFDVSRDTARRALAVLEQAGLLVRDRSWYRRVQPFIDIGRGE